jgi:hypothetical protein
MDTKKLFDGTNIPVMISTNERIFQIETFDGETILCNVVTAQKLLQLNLCKRIRHYWNHKFVTIGKLEVKEMAV